MPRAKASDRIARVDAVKALASILGVKPNTVQKRIAYAIKNGRLHTHSRGPDSFVVGELSAWAQTQRNWQDRAAAIAAAWPKIVSGTGRLILPALTATGAGACTHLLPDTLADCQALVAEYADKLAELQKENAALRQELVRKDGLIDQWRPVIERGNVTRQKKVDAGKRAKGVPKDRRR